MRSCSCTLLLSRRLAGHAQAMRIVVEDAPPQPLQEPLLGGRDGGGEGGGGEVPPPPPPQPALRGGTCSTAGGVSNLVTTAVGAGMVALPRAVSETGILLGMLLFLGTAALTLCSTSIIVRCEEGVALLWRVMLGAMHACKCAMA